MTKAPYQRPQGEIRCEDIAPPRDRLDGAPDRRSGPAESLVTDGAPGVAIMRAGGRARATGAEKGDAGWVYHAVDLATGRALCGRRLGRNSAGWTEGDPLVRAISCARCVPIYLRAVEKSRNP